MKGGAAGIFHCGLIEGERETDADVLPSAEFAPVEPLVSATIVDGDNVDSHELRENIRQDILREATEGEVVDLEKEGNRRRQIWVVLTCCVLAIGLGVGLGVGLSQQSNQQSNNNDFNVSSALSPTEAPSESPSMVPTTEQCHVCYDPNNNDAAIVSAQVESTTNWRSTVVQQTPIRTCQNVFDATLDLSLWDEECVKLQADASWKCGCPRFPPVPKLADQEEDDDNNSNLNTACNICPEGFEAVPISALDPVSTCVRATKWLEIVGWNATLEDCEALQRLAINGCRCDPVTDSNNNAAVEMTTGQCISVLDQILLHETGLADDTVPRTYVLCPHTVFQVGIANLAAFGTGNAIVNGQFPIVGMSNMKVLCGMDGSSANNCTIRDGSFGVFLVGFSKHSYRFLFASDERLTIEKIASFFSCFVL